MDFDKTPRNDGLTSEFTELFGRFELKPDCYYPNFFVWRIKHFSKPSSY